MDLGCLDLGCISVLEKQSNETAFDAEKQAGDAEESVVGTTKVRKSKVTKESCQSTINSINKSTSQIKKPHRKNSSPLTWFPRRKMDSYLKRKIRLLQEVGGMNSTLDETLGDSNPHYTRVLREKIAAREAACKAMEARKAAMVEASWYRILRAARIQSKEAESLLLKAEKSVAEAFEAAAAMGVIMYERPDCPRKACEIESSSINIGGSTTHTVTASFESAFEVDKEVAAAVKTAFIRLANCPSSSNKDDFKDLLQRFSQNPDMCETNEELSSSECESDDTLLELESESPNDGFFSQGGLHTTMPDTVMKQRKGKNRRLADVNSTKLVDMMLERLKCLQEDELGSLATIVATCGLNAALLEVENSKPHDPESVTDDASSTRNLSSLEAGTTRHSDIEFFKDGRVKRKQFATELPSLDKFLVKHVSRLEREVQEAKNSSKNQSKKGNEGNPEGSKNKGDSSNNVSFSESVPDLGSVLIKHTSRLEKEIEEAKKKSGKAFEKKDCKRSGSVQNVPDLPSLDKFLVKHVSRLEREVQEAKNTKKNELNEGSVENLEESENRVDENDSVTLSEAVPDLESILIKHSSKLEKEVAEAKEKLGKAFEKTCKRMESAQDIPEVPSLDKFLVKHVSRLEREVQEAKNTRNSDPIERSSAANSDSAMASSQDISSCMDEKQVDKENINLNKQTDRVLDGMAKEKLEMEQAEGNQNTTMVVPHKPVEFSDTSLIDKSMSRIERSKLETLEAFSLQDGSGRKGSDSSLDRILVKPVHRLEREKMQALALGSDYNPKKGREMPNASDCESLDKVLVKHVSRLEKEKIGIVSKEVQKVRRGSQFQSSSDGLDQILVKHQSRLEKEKLAVGQPSGDYQIKHSEVRREARERELQEAWGGLSLGNSIRPRLSRLERDKAAWIEAEEEERRRARVEM